MAPTKKKLADKDTQKDIVTWLVVTFTVLSLVFAGLSYQMYM